MLCDANNALTQCKQTYEGSWGYVSVGAKECVGDVLYACTDGSVKQTRCYDLVFNDQETGELISNHGKCSKDYNFIPDFDVCTPLYEGTACGNVTNEGKCNANMLSYCNNVTNLLDHVDCSQNETNSLCTIYKGYADCREPCTKLGEARCEIVDYGEEGVVSQIYICVQDAHNSSKLSYLLASTACIGDTLYTCDGTNVVTTDCSKTGGVCGMTACEYPLCSIASSEDCHAEQRCEVDATGNVIGTLSCDG
jgi:hypothetical protein